MSSSTFSPNKESLLLLVSCGICDFFGDVRLEFGGLRLGGILLSSGGGGEGAGEACLDPAGLNPLPLKGLTLPVGDGLLEPGLLDGSAIIAKAWFLLRLEVGVNL